MSARGNHHTTGCRRNRSLFAAFAFLVLLLLLSMAAPRQAWGSQPQGTMYPRTIIGPDQRILSTCYRVAFPPPSTYVYVYYVQPGDTLSQIAEQFGGIPNGVTVEEIALVNNIPDPNFILVGQVLAIPLHPNYGLSYGSPFTIPPPGAPLGVQEGNVLSGELDVYQLMARPGQQVSVSISSLEDNAAFQICQWAGPNPGQAVPGAGEFDDARAWSGVLPSGDYRIVVGATRGNASYRLEVTVV